MAVGPAVSGLWTGRGVAGQRAWRGPQTGTEQPTRVTARLAMLTGVSVEWIFFGDETGLGPRKAARLKRIERGLEQWWLPA